MRSVLPCRRYLGLVLALALLAFPLAALADDVDPTGEKLKSLESDPKYQAKLKELGGENMGRDYRNWCYAEIDTIVGGIIWGVRASKDHCKDYHRMDPLNYCLLYSEHCDHYHWKAACLSDENCPHR